MYKLTHATVLNRAADIGDALPHADATAAHQPMSECAGPNLRILTVFLMLAGLAVLIAAGLRAA